MRNVKEIFNAGRVRRWHTNPEMSWTEDYNDAHQGRVARILMALHPEPSLGLICAALTHDDGEFGPGDMSRDAKERWPELREMVSSAEDETVMKLWNIAAPVSDNISPSDYEWLKFADNLDAYMWSQHKNRPITRFSDWRKHREALFKFARSKDIVEELVLAIGHWHE